MVRGAGRSVIADARGESRAFKLGRMSSVTWVEHPSHVVRRGDIHVVARFGAATDINIFHLPEFDGSAQFSCCLANLDKGDTVVISVAIGPRSNPVPRSVDNPLDIQRRRPPDHRVDWVRNGREVVRVAVEHQQCGPAARFDDTTVEVNRLGSSSRRHPKHRP